MTTKMDKNLMKDPATANCRIYVGNLDKAVTENDIMQLFSQYGDIKGIMIQRNFGFVQFANEEAAKDALQKAMGTLLKGKKLNVRSAITGENKSSKQAQPQVKLVQEPSQQQQQPPPPPTQQQQQQQQHQVQSIPPPQKSPTPPPSSIEPIELERKNDPMLVNTNFPKRQRGGSIVRGGMRGGINNPHHNFRDRSPLNRGRDFKVYNRDDKYIHTGYGREPFASMIPPAPRRKADCNDCEIIVVAKSLTKYAEYIEHRLKTLGITVDLLFPNEDVPIGRVLANIASRGCLYAILVTPQNEEHGSLTLNILHGMPEEHRNMPTDDAIALLSRNFDAYVHGEKSTPGSSLLNALSERHPEAIQVLLNLLAENRLLTVLQYDRIIKYLQERRELQLKHELGDAADEMDTITTTVQTNNSSSSQTTELQNRILSILNNKTANNTTVDKSNSIVNLISNKVSPSLVSPVQSAAANSGGGVGGSTSSSAPAPLLNDPSVQKALDSLLQADLLKNIVVKPSSTNNSDNYGTNYSTNIRRF